MKMAAKELFLYVGNMSTSARLSSALLLGEQLARQKNMVTLRDKFIFYIVYMIRSVSITLFFSR